LPGDYCERATPVPIPNTEVKPLNADGTALGRESRSSPGFFYFKRARYAIVIYDSQGKGYVHRREDPVGYRSAE
jgi:hypothetical protein